LVKVFVSRSGMLMLFDVVDVNEDTFIRMTFW